jgi:hypothetical protein
MEEILLAKSHSINDCISGLKTQTPAEPGPKVLELLKGFEESGFDPLLGTFTKLLHRDSIPHVLSFLRMFRVLDVSDYERISNKCVNQTTDEEILALVDILNRKGPHAYWYVVHSMEEHTEFFSQMHGDIACCGESKLVKMLIHISFKSLYCIVIRICSFILSLHLYLQ